jgi:hypothetical protein
MRFADILLHFADQKPLAVVGVFFVFEAGKRGRQNTPPLLPTKSVLSSQSGEKTAA